MPVLNAIASAVRQSIARAVDPDSPRYVPNMPGNQKGEMPDWAPKSRRYSIAWRAAHTNTLNTVCSTATTADHFVRVSDGGAVTLRTGGLENNKNVASYCDVAEVNSYVIDAFADGWDLYVNGAKVGTRNVLPSSVLPVFQIVGQIGISGQPQKGQFEYLHFIDHDALQNCWSMPENQEARIPEHSIARGSIEFTWNRTDTPEGSYQKLFRGPGGAGGIVAYNSTEGANAGYLELNNGGGALPGFSGGLTNVALGEDVRIRFEWGDSLARCYVNNIQAGTEKAFAPTMSFYSIYADQGTVTDTYGQISDVVIKNHDTGEAYRFNNANDPDNVLINSASKDVFGPELWVNPTLQNQWVDLGGGRYRLDGDVGGALNQIAIAGLEVGELYRLTISTDEVVGELKVYGTESPYPNYLYPQDEKTQTIDFVAEVPGLSIARATPGAQTVAEVWGISVRKVIERGTAEGVNWVERAAGWQTFDADISIVGDRLRITNTKEGVRGFAQCVFDVRGESFLGKRVHVGLGARLSGTGEAWVSNPFKSIVEGTSEYHDFTDAGAYAIRCNSYTKGDYVEFDLAGTFFKRVTHGLWYKSNALMSKSAASAARVWQNKIDRRFDFANMPRVIPHSSSMQLGMILKGDGQLYIPLKPMVFAGAFDFSFDWTPTALTSDSNRFWGELDTFNSEASVNQISLGFKIGTSGIVCNDFPTTFFTVGQTYKIRFWRDTNNLLQASVDGVKSSVTANNAGVLTIAYLWRANSTIGNSTMANLKFHNKATGHLYHYPMIGDVGNVVRNASTEDRFGPNKGSSNRADYFHTAASGLTSSQDGEYIRVVNTTGSSYDVYLPEGVTGYKLGDLLRVTLDVQSVSGQTQAVAGYTGPGVGPAVTQPGRYTFDLIATGNANVGFRAISGSTVVARILSVQKIYSLATAYGDELIGATDSPFVTSYPEGLKCTRLSRHSVRIEATDNVNSYPSAGFGTLEGLANGDIIEISARCKATQNTFISSGDAALAGTNRLYFRPSNKNTDGSVTVKLVTTVRALSSSNALRVYIDLAAGAYQVGDYAEIYDLKVTKVTHGIFHDNASKAPVAAYLINNARVFLPELPKQFAEGGDVYTLSDSEGVELVTDYSERVWTGAEADFATHTAFVGKTAAGKSYLCRFIVKGTGSITLKCDLNLASKAITVKDGTAQAHFAVVVTPTAASSVSLQIGTTDKFVGTTKFLGIVETNALKWTGIGAGNIIEGELA